MFTKDNLCCVTINNQQYYLHKHIIKNVDIFAPLFDDNIDTSIMEINYEVPRFIIDNVYENFTFYPHESDELVVLRNSIMTGVGSFHETFKNRLDHFISQVKGGVDPSQVDASGYDALACQEVIEAAIRSHRENGAVIEVPPVKKTVVK